MKPLIVSLIVVIIAIPIGFFVRTKLVEVQLAKDYPVGERVTLADGTSAVVVGHDGDKITVLSRGNTVALPKEAMKLVNPKSAESLIVKANPSEPIPIEGLPKISEEEANKRAAASALKSGIFPAMVAFQSGGYIDANQDGIGEYGFFSEMAGLVPVKNLKLSFLPPSFAAHQPVNNG